MLFHEQKTFNSFQKTAKISEKTIKKNKNSINQKKKIKITVNIKKKQIRTLINSTLDISYMNSHLQKKLKIKERKQKQLLIIKNTK